MARLAAQAQAEYYPTPDSVAALVASYLEIRAHADKFTRLYDPCCGTGKAVADVAALLKARVPEAQVQVWGSELHEGRAAEAATLLDQALCAPFEAVDWRPARGIASVLFLNPPYDWSEEGGRGARMEEYFLNRGSQALVPGGVLVFIIPVSALTWRLTQALYMNYEDVVVTRFPDAEYAQFKQVVIFGKRREQALNAYDVYHEAQWLESFGHTRYNAADPRTLPQLTLQDPPRYVAPSLQSHKAQLFRHQWAAEEVQAALRAPATPFPDQEVGALEILRPLKRGHLAQILAAGLMGTLTLDNEVLKGLSVKRVELSEEDDGATHKTIERTKWETHLVRVTEQGLEYYEGAQALPFLETHANRLAQELMRRVVPYGDRPTPAENRILETLSRGRERPGGGYGLYDNQRESAVAAVRAIRRHGIAHLIAEMGYGKTTTAGGVLALLGDYPAFVMCPPHLVEKWARELTDVVPGCQPEVVNNLAELQAVVAQYRPGDKLIVIASQNKVKMGPGWEAATGKRYTFPRPANATAQVISDYRRPFRKALAEYQETQAALRAAYEAAPEDTALHAQLREQLATQRQAALQTARAYPVCPHCGDILPPEVDYAKEPRQCRGQRADVKALILAGNLDREEGRDSPLYRDHVRQCQRALYHNQPKLARRWPLDHYIQRQLPGFFKVLVVDEVHEYKAGESDRGAAFGRMCQAIPQVLTLTGTFYGGVSSSLFYLLMRTQRDMQREWALSEEERWIETYGRIQKVYSETSDGSRTNARSRVRVNTKEIPGTAPTVLRHLLHTAIFCSIADLGVGLPPFADEVVTFPMTTAQQQDYERVERFTWNLVREYRNRYLSSWLQWTLARPNSGFRKEVIEGVAEDEVLVVDAVFTGEELSPKEEWLVQHCRQERAQGRKVLVYLRQTATRDIRKRLLAVLQRAGITAAELPDGVAPKRREAWVNAQQPDVLITNPRRVATGLDLVMYHSAVFYEIEYSLYTLWQATRRVWRLGQEKPVKVYYLVYAGTMEERAINLIGAKMAASQMLYGDDVAGALVDDSDDSSIVQQLMQVIESGAELVRVTSILGHDDHTTWSPVGSPTRKSPVLFWAETWLREQGFASVTQVVQPKKARAAKVSPAQIALFPLPAAPAAPPTA